MQQNGLALKHVPEDLRTADLCKAAVNQDGMALEYVPKEIKENDREICLVAMKQTEAAYWLIPVQFADELMTEVLAAKGAGR